MRCCTASRIAPLPVANRLMTNIPNLLTLLRVLLIPVFILLFYLPFEWSYLAASAVFAVASLTDWLDGYLARRWEQSTPFGAFLDPVADKLMVAVALVMLVEEHASFWLTLPAVIIIGREIVVSALREWMAELGARAQVAVSNLGQVEDHRTDGRAGHSDCQSAAIVCLCSARLPPADRGRRIDTVVDGAVPAGRLAAPQQ